MWKVETWGMIYAGMIVRASDTNLQGYRPFMF